MRRGICIVLFFAVTVFSCASHSGEFREKKNATLNPSGLNSSVLPQMVLNQYRVEFAIPNPFAEDGGTAPRRIDPSHQNTILCHATLLDSISTEADILARCRRDSLSDSSAAAFREKYLREQVQPGRFRIRIAMESGFSPMSIDPRHWAIYIADAKGVLIEPVLIQTVPVSTSEDSLYSDYYRKEFRRIRITGAIILYFDRVTFFGEDLLGPENPYIALEMAREMKTVVRVTWKNMLSEKKGTADVRAKR